jgi:DNA polymerase-1
MKRVLILDALNAYLRAYIVDPSLSVHGQPIGGLRGFLKILQKLVREMRPDQVVVIWDGPNGSKKRKLMDKNYKAGRKPIRLNRAYHNLTEDEELKNKIWQQSRIIEYLNQMPIIQSMIEEVEADDIIAYVSQMSYYKGWQKIIVSNDKDFMQLCDGETVLWRPTQGEMLNKNRIVEQLGIHPANMAMARAIIGDASDNLPGIKGAGFATVKKRLDFLAEERYYNIDEVVEYCENVPSNLSFFKKIVEDKALIEKNYKMMQLYSPQLSVQAKDRVKYAVENFECEFNKTQIIGMMKDDGIGALNWDDLKVHLNKISRECVGNDNT